MTLLPAIATYLAALGITGAFPIGRVHDAGQSTPYTLIQDVGSHDDDRTRTHLFPTVQLTFRRTTQAAAHTDAWTVYRALNGTRTVVGRTQCPAHPVDLGPDGKALWGYALDVNVSLHYSATI